MSEEYNEYESDEALDEDQELQDEDLEDLDDEYEPRNEFEDIDDDIENDFEPKDEKDYVDNDLENNFEPRNETFEDYEKQTEEKLKEEGKNKQPKIEMSAPGENKPPSPVEPPRQPKPRKPGYKIPLGLEGKGPLLNNNIKNNFKRKNWQKGKDRFTKTEKEINQDLTKERYKNLRNNKKKV
ncbi:MAG: hypothetical protein ACFFDH_03115 [Promethearchaeota archaeon]